jgi:hypothetical protein
MSVQNRTCGRPGLRAIAFAIAATCLAACAYERPQSRVTPGLDSGITSSNGGGTRALGNQPNVGIRTGTGQ